MTTPLVILGAGGHARELLDIVERLPEIEFLGFLSGAPHEVGQSVDGYAVLGAPEWCGQGGRSVHVILGVGSPALKQTWSAAIKLPALPRLVDPSSLVSARAVTLGNGVVLCANSIISNHVTLGEHTHVNRGAQIAHDCKVGAFCHIAPGAVLSGRVTVGDLCEIGANATILPGRSVGDRAVVGAGAVVTHDVPAGAVVAGVPARPLR